MTQEELIAQVQSEMRSYAALLITADYTVAVTYACGETGWAFPTPDSFHTLWMSQRVRRHLFFYLMQDQARKFRVEALYLDQRYTHYKETVDMMDKEFREVKEEHPEQFPSAATFTDEQLSVLFGFSIGPGFTYDALGRDTTYENQNTVVLSSDTNE